MKKYIKIISLLLAIPVIFLSSCGDIKYNKYPLHLKQHLYVVDKDIQDSNKRIHLNLGNIEREQLRQINSDLPNYFHSPFIAGGWGEERLFYSDTSHLEHHVGIDIMFDINKPIIAPASGKLIASAWLKNNNSSFAQGIGGYQILEVNIQDLEIANELKEIIYYNAGSEAHPKLIASPKMLFMLNGEYIKPQIIVTKSQYEDYLKSLSEDKRNLAINSYNKLLLTFMHLSKEATGLYAKEGVKNFKTQSNYSVSINTNISWDHPYKIKKGDILGYQGKYAENGGWIPHVHVNTYSWAPSSLLSRRIRYSDLSNLTNEELFKKVRSFKPTGVLIDSRESPRYPTILEFSKREAKSGLFDPNNIYQFYNENDRVMSFKL